MHHTTRPGDVDRLVADDHAALLRTFDALDSGRGDAAALVDQIVADLSVHLLAEHTVVHPALAAAGDRGLAAQARRDHRALTHAVATVRRHGPGEPELLTALSALRGLVRDHIAREELTRNVRLRARLGGAALSELGERFLLAKGAAPTRPHPSTPGSAFAARLARMVAGPLDLTRDRLSGRASRLMRDASGDLDPQAQALLDGWAQLGPVPLEGLHPRVARDQPSLGAAMAMELLFSPERRPDRRFPCSISTYALARPGEETIEMRLYRPLGEQGVLPVIVHLPGGGWVMGTVDDHEGSARSLATRCRALVVSVGYRKAPEHPFPAGHDDCLAVLQWALTAAHLADGDSRRVAVVGEGSGATMAAAATWQLTSAAAPVPVALVLVCPVTTIDQVGASFSDAADAVPVSRVVTSWWLHWLFRDSLGRVDDPRVTLLSLPEADLARFPPTLVVTAGRDPLRSQGEMFADRLAGAGAAVERLQVPGAPHDFFGLESVMDGAVRAQEAAARLLTRCFAVA